MKEKLKNVIRGIWRSRPYRWVLFGMDHVALRSAKTPARSGEPYTLFLAPPTGENIGDQAMFDSVIENTPGRIVTVITGENFVLPRGEEARRVELHVIPGLIHRPPFARFTAARRFGTLVKGADKLVAPGADTVDGAHPHGSLARLSLIAMGVKASIPTVLQGFSWMDGVAPTVLQSVRELGDAGTTICPRDPLSNRRLNASGVSKTVQVADLAFASDRKEPLYPELQGFVDSAREDGAPYALFNASGLINRHHDLLSDYATVIARLHSRGIRVVFTSHVHRDWDDDFTMARNLHALAGREDDLVIDRLLTPAQVRELASGAHLTVSGRMHLAILSLGQEIPVVCLATRGKVEGLFEFFGLPDSVVEPRPGCGDELVRVVDSNLDGHKTVTAKIREKLPAVKALAYQNFPYVNTVAEDA